MATFFVQSSGAETSESAQNSLQWKRSVELFQAVLGSMITWHEGQRMVAHLFRRDNVCHQLLVPVVLLSARSIPTPAMNHNRNDSAPNSLFGSACVRRNKSKHHGTRIVALAHRHSIANYSPNLVVRRAARLVSCLTPGNMKSPRIFLSE
jgi:hypothetical protein